MNLHQCPITEEEKRHMIAEAAYFRSFEPGFDRNNPLEDWLAAEAEVENSLQEICQAGPRRKTIADYHRLGLLPGALRWINRLKTRIEKSS